MDVVVPVDMKESDLLNASHGISNFIFMTQVELVEQLKAAIAAQLEEQHATVLAEARYFDELYNELRQMFSWNQAGGYTLSQTFDLARAHRIRSEMQAILRKYGEDDSGLPGTDMPYVFQALAAQRLE